MPTPDISYWAQTLYKDPRKRPKADQPIRDLPTRSAGRFRQAREGIRALKHVTEQVVFLGTKWKWVWMYEVGGRKLAYLHPMESSVSGTFILSEAEEQEFGVSDGLSAAIRQAIKKGDIAGVHRWCWMEFPDLETVEAFVHVVQQKHHFLARPDSPIRRPARPCARPNGGYIGGALRHGCRTVVPRSPPA